MASSFFGILVVLYFFFYSRIFRNWILGVFFVIFIIYAIATWKFGWVDGILLGLIILTSLLAIYDTIVQEKEKKKQMQKKKEALEILEEKKKREKEERIFTLAELKAIKEQKKKERIQALEKLSDKKIGD